YTAVLPKDFLLQAAFLSYRTISELLEYLDTNSPFMNTETHSYIKPSFIPVLRRSLSNKKTKNNVEVDTISSHLSELRNKTKARSVPRSFIPISI
ncbi:hypothetical protein, partial [Acinetobacter seifertii]|uniref:hypothetical protein n=1 Tax=Acinetobacter seifertii TaxID=1530123 RepID=UPI00148BC7BF